MLMLLRRRYLQSDTPIGISLTMEVTDLTDSQRERLHGDLLNPSQADLIAATVSMQFPGSTCQVLVTGNFLPFGYKKSQLYSLGV